MCGYFRQAARGKTEITVNPGDQGINYANCVAARRCALGGAFVRLAHVACAGCWLGKF